MFLLAQSVPTQITNSPAETALRYVFAVAVIALTGALVWMTRKLITTLENLNQKRAEEAKELTAALQTAQQLMDREDERHSK